MEGQLVSFLFYMILCLIFFKDFPLNTVMDFKILHVLKAYASKCSKKGCLLINILKSKNDVYKTKESLHLYGNAYSSSYSAASE